MVAERVILVSPETLPEGATVTLCIHFSSEFDGSMNGYYKSTWPGGVYALTLFEVSDMMSTIVNTVHYSYLFAADVCS